VMASEFMSRTTEVICQDDKRTTAPGEQDETRAAGPAAAQSAKKSVVFVIFRLA